MWGFKPKILFVKSVLKPFITDITIIKIATPSIIPRKENIEIIFKKPSKFSKPLAAADKGRLFLIKKCKKLLV